MSDTFWIAASLFITSLLIPAVLLLVGFGSMMAYEDRKERMHARTE